MSSLAGEQLFAIPGYGKKIIKAHPECREVYELLKDETFPKRCGETMKCEVLRSRIRTVGSIYVFAWNGQRYVETAKLLPDLNIRIFPIGAQKWMRRLALKP